MGDMQQFVIVHRLQLTVQVVLLLLLLMVEHLPAVVVILQLLLLLVCQLEHVVGVD
jgi:hypothetical protein